MEPGTFISEFAGIMSAGKPGIPSHGETEIPLEECTPGSRS